MSYSESLDHLRRIDLNLLVTLHYLLETRSTTLTAQAVHRTQPAVSVSLRRLRDYFDDPLLERQGQAFVPTPFAQKIQTPLQSIVHSVNELVKTGASYRLRADAPNTDIQLAEASLEITDYTEGMKLLLDGKIDLLISFYINDVPTGVSRKHLKNQSWSVVARKNHPISDIPDLKEWASYGHIQINSGETGRNPVTDVLASHKLSRKVCLKMNGFLQALHVVAESDLIFTTMTPLVTPLVKHLSLREIPLPFEIPPVPCCIMTRAIEHDPLSAWLLDRASSVLSTGVK